MTSPLKEQCPNCGHIIRVHLDSNMKGLIGCVTDNCPCPMTGYDAYAQMHINGILNRVSKMRDDYYDQGQRDGFTQALQLISGWRTAHERASLNDIPSWGLASTYRLKHGACEAYQFKTPGDLDLRRWCAGVFAPKNPSILRIRIDSTESVEEARLGDWIVLQKSGHQWSFSIVPDAEFRSRWDGPWTSSGVEVSR